MRRPIRASEPASDELSEAVHWYEVRRTGLGGEFFDAVAATLAHIEARPEIGTPISTDGYTAPWLPDSPTRLCTGSGQPKS